MKGGLFARILSGVVFLVVARELYAQNDPADVMPAVGSLERRSYAAQVQEFDHTHSLWNKALTEYVLRDGAKSTVRYGAIKGNPHQLQSYLDTFSLVDRIQFDRFSEDQKLAFLINAYNAYTLTLVVNNYPVPSIKKIGGLFRSPWKIEFFKLFGEIAYLDKIEHEIIRKQFDEPRIHFALVCAARSCPSLRNEAYTAAKLDEQLNDAASGFLRDRDRNYFDPASNTLYLSKIFDWYGEDFVKKFGSVKAFVAPFIAKDKQEQALIEKSSSVMVSYLPYDWALNDAGTAK